MSATSAAESAPPDSTTIVVAGVTTPASDGALRVKPSTALPDEASMVPAPAIATISKVVSVVSVWVIEYEPSEPVTALGSPTPCTPSWS